MTLLAKKWGPPRQRSRVIGAVGLVTVRAVFGHRLVLPQMRPANFRVAFETTLVDRRTGKHGFVETSMGLMTVRAGHFAELHRVAIRTVDLCSLLDMAVTTDLCLTR